MTDILDDKPKTPANAAVPHAEDDINCIQISMGHGLVDVTHISHRDRIGLMIHPRVERIHVGQQGSIDEGTYWPVPGDVVVWIDNLEGLRVIEKYMGLIAERLDRAAAKEISHD